MNIERRRHRLTNYCGALMLVLVSANASALNLANEPLFVTAPVKPNVILAVDDSGSMDSEVLFATNDGALWWHTG